jgi:hypothetical protein
MIEAYFYHQSSDVIIRAFFWIVLVPLAFVAGAELTWHLDQRMSVDEG